LSLFLLTLVWLTFVCNSHRALTGFRINTLLCSKSTFTLISSSSFRNITKDTARPIWVEVNLVLLVFKLLIARLSRNTTHSATPHHRVNRGPSSLSHRLFTYHLESTSTRANARQASIICSLVEVGIIHGLVHKLIVVSKCNAAV
jgi:hypothetical protein